MAAPTLTALALVCSLKRRPGPVADATARPRAMRRTWRGCSRWASTRVTNERGEP